MTENNLAPSEEGEEAPQPLRDRILNHGFRHPLEHFTQFYLERDDVEQATRMQQRWADSVQRPELPAGIRAISLYTLALFYATTKQEIPALETLRQARAFNPDPGIQSIILYTLAHSYATSQQPARAAKSLREALALNPALAEYSRADPDLQHLL